MFLYVYIVILQAKIIREAIHTQEPPLIPGSRKSCVCSGQKPVYYKAGSRGEYI